MNMEVSAAFKLYQTHLILQETGQGGGLHLQMSLVKRALPATDSQLCTLIMLSRGHGILPVLAGITSF